MSKKEEETIKKFKRELSLESIPEDLRTEKVCVIALSDDFPANIGYVPAGIKSENFLSKRIQSERKALDIVGTPSFMPGNEDLLLQYIPKKLKTIDVCQIAIEHNPSNIKYVPKKILTAEFLKDMVMVNGELIQLLPEDQKTEELCRLAFENNIDAISYIPESMVTQADCERYITESFTISALPEKYLTPSLLALGVRSKEHRSDRLFFERIPKEFKTPELMIELIKLDADYLSRFSGDFTELGMNNEETILNILAINGECLQHVPRNLLTDQMCLIALKTQCDEYELTGRKVRYIELLKFFPKSSINHDVASKAIAVNKKNLQYIPEKLKTEELIEEAIASAGGYQNIIKYIPNKMITENMCIDIVNDNLRGFADIPDEKKTERVCQAALKASSYFEDIIDQIPKDLHLPEILIHCKKSRYPNVKQFTQLMDEWVDNKAASNDDFALLLANAPENLQKSDAWKKWALIYL